VPVEALPPWLPFTCQLTAVLLAPLMVALNCRFAPTPMEGEVGLMATAGAVWIFTEVPDPPPQPDEICSKTRPISASICRSGMAFLQYARSFQVLGWRISLNVAGLRLNIRLPEKRNAVARIPTCARAHHTIIADLESLSKPSYPSWEVTGHLVRIDV
jgi:hypothetical protein